MSTQIHQLNDNNKSLQKQQQQLCHVSNYQFIPFELSTQYYTRWDCDIQTKLTSKGYFKCLEGKGQVQFCNGNTFKGYFYNGLMHGDNCEFIWKNGLIYKGQFKNNTITGNGQYKWPDGSSYTGSLLNGKRHGKGDYYCAKDKSKYYGQFKNGVKHGYGMLQFNEQSYYEGYFYQGFRHGKGKMKYISGNLYQGEWLNDKKNGYGVMNWFNENQKYQGDWKHDQQHGFGTYYWYDGKIQYKIIKNIYKGYWLNGQRNGFGAFFFSNGCKYQGYFSNSCKQGYGIVMDQNGNIKLQYFQKNKLIFSIPQSSGVTNLLTNSRQTNVNIDSVQNIASNSKSKALIQKSSKLINPSNTVQKQSGRSSKPIQLIKKGVNNTKLPSLNNRSKQQTEQRSIIVDQRSQILDSSILTQKLRQQKSFIQQPQQHLQLSNINIHHNKQNKQIQQNIYSKCLDLIEYHQIINLNDLGNQNKLADHNSINLNSLISCAHIDKNITNLLLRQNSKLKSWYKYCCTYGSLSNISGKDNYYTGLTIQNMWRLIKDIRVTDQYINIPKLNKEFFKGWKSNYQIYLPNQKKLELIQKYLIEFKENNNSFKDEKCLDNLINSQKVNYNNIEWVMYTQEIINKTQDIINKQTNHQQQKQIDLNNLNDIHNPKKMILFRHFVAYLLRLAFLQTKKSLISSSSTLLQPANIQKQFKIQIQRLFKTINTFHQSILRDSRAFNNTQTDNISHVSKQKILTVPTEDFSKLNKQLFNQITSNQKCMKNVVDRTIMVRTVYELLEKFSLLKQVNEKMMFMDKIERIFQVENKSIGSVFKKDLKQHFNALEKLVYTSPYFNRLLNYTLTQKDFQQVIYLAINRKINTSSKQQAIKKYKQIIDSIKQYVKKQSQKSHLINCNNKIMKIKIKKTEKDFMKQELLRKAEQQRKLKEQQERKRKQKERQLKEQKLMNKEDFRWEDLQNSSQSSQDFFDDQ